MIHGVAKMWVEQMLNGLMEGTLLVVIVWLLLRLLPRRNSGTRFAVWFSVLISIMILPFLGNAWKTGTTASTQPGAAKAPLIIPASWATYMFMIWGLIAAVALARVITGIWQIYKLRRSCTEVRLDELDPAVRGLIEEFRQSRAVSFCISEQIQVPTAIGFLKPAVVMPAWLLKEVSTAELQQVLVHEMTHLRRHDDWTNLEQKEIKSFLFFHPSVWWIEQRLSLEREMACDDAVLARTANARDYAQCLTRVAEKSFLRRQMALAQAVVNRMGQLSLRVAQILDVNRPGATALWKPAIPLVMALVLLCGISAWHAPALIGFEDHRQQQTLNSGTQAAPLPQRAIAQSRESIAEPKLVLAKADTNASAPPPARATKRPAPRLLRAKVSAGAGNYLIQQQAVIITTSGNGQSIWQIHTWEIHFVIPDSTYRKNQAPRKST